MTAAVSAAELVERAGSYAGLAAVIGLAVLGLLYFTQAREVRRLREWAGRAPERAVELEQRVQSDAQRRVVAQPIAPASAAAQQQAATAALYSSVGASPPGQLARPSANAPASAVPGAPVAPAAVPGGPAAPAAPTAAPAGPGAPAAPAVAPGAPGAVPAAPTAAPGGPGAVTGTPAPVPAKPPAPGAVPGAGEKAPAPAPAPVPAADAGAPAATGAQPAPTPNPAPTPAPATPGAATATPPGAPAAATAAAAARMASASSAAATPPVLGNGAANQATAESAAARPAPTRAPAPLAPSEDEERSGRSRVRIGLIVFGAIAAVLAAIVVAVSLTGGEGAPRPNDFGSASAPQSPGGGQGASPGAASSSLAAADRRATNVAVLNGTTQTGLARNVADKIQENDYTIGSVGNNADQQVPRTVVSYTAGNERAALAVAKLIGIARAAVRPADANTSAAADADVVVTVGSDQIE